jgi:Heavy-metal resistance
MEGIMRKRSAVNIITVAAMIGIIGFAGSSFAKGGKGYGYYRGDCPVAERAGCPGRGEGRGQGKGYPAGLSEEDTEKFDAMREAFRESTRPLKENLYEKVLALRGEMAKQTPDAMKAAGLQEDISKLRADFDAQRLAHRIEMKNAFPGADFGPGRGHGRGNHHGRAKGYGSGGCWQ